MNQTNRLLVWFMIYNFKVNYSKDNLFFPNNFIDTSKSNTERRWETILINSRQSKKKRKRELPMYPSLVNSGTKHSFIIILIYQNQSKQKKKKIFISPKSGTNLIVLKKKADWYPSLVNSSTNLRGERNWAKKIQGRKCLFFQITQIGTRAQEARVPICLS